MHLIENQPVYLRPSVDSSFQDEGERFKTLFAENEYIYVQWTLDLCSAPLTVNDIQIYTSDGILVKTLGTYVNQTTNRNWFTMKFKFTELSLNAGCYYLQWNECPGGVSSIQRSETFEVLAASNLGGTKLVTASCDCYGHGFDWSVFVLQWRVPFAKFNPEYDLESDDYQDSNETNIKYYAERKKYHSCRTAAMDEGAHDALTVQLLCDVLLIDTVEFYFDKKDYTMGNDKDGKTLLFDANFTLRKQNSTTVNNNCKDCDNEIYPYYG